MIHENGLRRQGGRSQLASPFLAQKHVLPVAGVHQSSIRAQAAAHDVSIRSSTSARCDRRGWASQSVSRSWRTINHPENARTGTSALGDRAAPRARHDGRHTSRLLGCSATTAELVVIDAITEHDVEPDEEFTRERDFCLGSAASMQDGEVATAKVIVYARGEGEPPDRGPSGGARCLAS